MANIFSRYLNVNPGTELSVRVSSAIQPDGRNPDDPPQEATIRIGPNTRRIQLDIVQAEPVQQHSAGAPEIGRPALGIVEDPATAGIKQR